MGNRRDAIKVKDMNIVNSIMPHIKPIRADSDVYINFKVDMTELIKYYENLKKDSKNDDLTYFHLFSTAIGKMVYNRPLLNRFIMNRSLYHRKDVTISFVAKRELTDESEESFKMINVEENDNLFTIKDKIINSVKNLRNNQEHETDKLMNFVAKSPKWFKRIIIGLIKLADRHDLLPASITKDLLYYSTVIVSNLGSIGCDAIYHNITDFGTNSALLMIGQIKDEVVAEDGKPVVKKMCEFGVNLDERIADGFYFAKSLKLFEYILTNPHLLEDSVDTKVEIPKKK